MYTAQSKVSFNLHINYHEFYSHHFEHLYRVALFDKIGERGWSGNILSTLMLIFYDLVIT